MTMRAILFLILSSLCCLGQLSDPAWVASLTIPATGSPPAAPAAGYAAWYKAGVGVTNSSGSAATDGSNVKSWQDSSGNGYHIVQVLNLYPTNRASILNGYSVIEFTNTEKGLAFTGTALNLDRNVNGFTMVVVFSPLAASTAERDIIDFNKNAAGSARSAIFFGYPTANKIGVGGRTLDADAIDANAGSTLSLGSWYIASAVFNNSGATKKLYLNGTIDVDDASYHAPGAATSDAASADGAVGSIHAGGTTQTFDGYIAEVLIYQSALSDTDRQTTEAYLNAKFAIY